MKTLVEKLRKLSAENPSPRDCIDEAADELEKAIDPCRVAEMTWHCQNIDQDLHGWYATIYVSERGEHVCGRGPNIWAAVKEAHRLAANGEVRGASRLAGEASSAEGATSTVVLGHKEGNDGN